MLKVLLEFGPLLVFFVGYKIGGLLNAAIYMALATAFALVIDYIARRQINKMHLVSLGVLLISVAFTLYSGNSDFLKLKPTILYSLFAVLFLGAGYFGKSMAEIMLGGQIIFAETKHWKVLDFRFAVFFLVIAIANELIWRNFSEEIWVNFKVMGILPINILFIFSQVPYIMRHNQAQDLK